MRLFVLLIGLLFVPVCIAQTTQTATVIAVNANLRGTPSESGKVVQVVPQNTKLEVFKQKEAWFLVQAPEYVGWMHGNTIKLDPPPTTASIDGWGRGIKREWLSDDTALGAPRMQGLNASFKK
jgi:hypothetical protein